MRKIFLSNIILFKIQKQFSFSFIDNLYLKILEQRKTLIG
jgi:hypothetical protein